MKYFDQSIEEIKEFLDFIEEDLENVQRVVKTLENKEVEPVFKVHDKAETVEQSAENTDLNPENIIKTLVFIGEQPFAVLCPGNNRVDEKKLEKLTGDKVRMAEPEEVEEATGYKVGGVSPFDLDIPVYMEESILQKEKVKPAAGSRVIGLEIKPGHLQEITDTKKAKIIQN